MIFIRYLERPDGACRECGWPASFRYIYNSADPSKLMIASYCAECFVALGFEHTRPDRKLIDIDVIRSRDTEYMAWSDIFALSPEIFGVGCDARHLDELWS